MTQKNVPTDYALIESAIGGNKNDLRTLLQNLVLNDQTLATSTGTQFGQSAQNVAPPAQAGFAVSGANGAYTATIANPAGVVASLWHEVSYSTVKGFTSNVTTLPATQATSVTLNLPGQSLFFRLRSSTNRQTWNDYQLSSQSVVSSGLISSAATSAGAAFNQTNFGVVTSTAVGASANVQVQGAGSALSSMVAVKGKNQSILPGATIIGVTPGSSQFVAWTGSNYVLRPTLAAVLDDDLTPVGKVSVVGTGTPTLPVVTPIISGGHIIGTSFTPGAGLSAVPTFTVTDPGGPGTGAVVVGTGVTAGELDGIQILNSGDNYDGSTLITASGGVFPGQDGGGTAAGGNGGRLTAV